MFDRKLLCTALLLFALLLPCTPAQASTEWLQTRGPEGGDISVLVVDPSNSATIYAGMKSGGMFKSSDGGASWNAINSERLSGDVYGIVIDPADSQTVYCQADGLLSKSTDAGLSWSSVDSGFPPSPIGLPVFDPSDSQTSYVWTSSGPFKSSNGGTTWSAANNGLNSLPVGNLAIDSTNSQTLYAWSWQGLFKSTDSGASWNALASGQPGGFITSFAIDPTSGTIYVASDITSLVTDWATGQTSYAVDAGVYKSTDGGATWSNPNNALKHTSVRSLSIDPTNSQTIYAGTFLAGVFKSVDGGGTWSAVNSGLFSTAGYIVAIDPNNGQNIYAGSVGGIAKSTNGGASWSPANRGIVRSEVLSLAMSPASDQAVYAGTKGGVFKSSNRGGSWIPASSGLDVGYVGALAVDPASAQTIYAGTDAGMFKSANGGDSWSAINTGISAGTFVSGLAIDPDNSQNIYISAYHPTAHTGGLFKSSNGGATWIALNGLQNNSYYSVAIDPTNSQTIYAASLGWVSKSTDGGATWNTSIAGSYPHGFFSAVAVHPTDGQTVYAVSRQGVLKSINGGGSWSLVNSGLLNTDVHALVVAQSQTLYAGTPSGVFKSSDGGSSWNEVNSGQIGASNVLVQSLAIDSSSQTLYAGTNHFGVFRGISTLDLPTISGTPVVTATVGTPYSFTPASTNAATFSITGSLPSGLALDSMTGTLSGTPSALGTYGDILVTATNANGSVSLPPFTISVSAPLPQQYPLTVTFAGNGGGSVNGGISCSNGAICAPTTFLRGANLTLMASPDANSLFAGWSGDCSVTGNNCRVTMDGARSVTATFNAAPPVRISGGAPYEGLSLAYAAAANNAVIQARAISFDNGDLICDRLASVSFIGGYNADFSVNSGLTAVKGRLLIRKGTVRVGGLALK